LQTKWFNSADDGAIQVSIGPELKVDSWREIDGRYWNYRK
jgi:hypothetical protein